MAIAYLLTAYQNPAQVARLIRAIHHPDDLLIVHASPSAPRETHELLRSTGRMYSNVVVLRSRELVRGGYQIICATIEAMEIALATSSRWHHFVNVSGQDFPLKPRGQIIARLGAAPSTNYVSWFSPFDASFWSNARERVERYHLHSPMLHRVITIPGVGRRIRDLVGWKSSYPYLPFYKRKLPEFFKYYGGSHQVVLSREGCRYMTTSSDARRILSWVKHCGIPDESIFQSALLNSPLAMTVVNDDCREVHFAPKAPHPRVFTSADFDRLKNSPALWARKFDEKVDSKLLDLMEAYIAQPS